MERALFSFPLDTRVMIVGLALETLVDEQSVSPEVLFVPRSESSTASPTPSETRPFTGRVLGSG